MTKHKCPDCGAAHEMDAEGRIKRLEDRVAELEAKQSVCPHPHWYWTSGSNYPLTVTDGTAWNPNLDDVTITYDFSTGRSGGDS